MTPPTPHQPDPGPKEPQVDIRLRLPASQAQVLDHLKGEESRGTFIARELNLAGYRVETQLVPVA